MCVAATAKRRRRQMRQSKLSRTRLGRIVRKDATPIVVAAKKKRSK